jgi:type IV pilus assembly protein PilW
MRPAKPTRRRARGFSLIEVMVGLVIGIIALIVVYQVFNVAEGYKRTTTSGGDAQTTGLVSTFLIGQEIASAGSTISMARSDLDSCPPAATFETSLRPIPVLIHDGGNDAVSDSIDILYGTSPLLIAGSDLRNTNASPTDDYLVQSPFGYRKDDLFVIAGGGNCELLRVTNAPVPDADGVVSLSHAVAAHRYPAGSSVVNLGPDPNVSPNTGTRKLRYDTSDSLPCAAGCVLRSTDLLTGAVPNPIASNVVLMKAQYGLDLDGDGFIDTWQAPNGAWAEAAVLAKSKNDLRLIKAVRIAMIVRSSQYERSLDAEGNPLRGSTDPSRLDQDFRTTLFPCNGLPGCTGEIANVVLPQSRNYRYKVFEQVVPLRSQIWTAQ